MRRFCLILLFCLILNCCKSPKKQEIINLPGSHTLWDRPKAIDYDADFVLTFNVNQTEFRLLRVPNGSFDLQVLRKDKWSTNLKLPFPSNRYFFNQDINKDGCYDLVDANQEEMKIYFFDSATSVLKIKPIIFPMDYNIIDTKRLIFGGNIKTSKKWNIELFQLRNDHKVYLNKLDIFLDDHYKPLHCKLYKCINGEFSDTVFLRDIAINQDYVDFHLFQFMQDIIRKEYKFKD